MQDLHEIGGCCGSWCMDLIFIFVGLGGMLLKILSLAVNDAAGIDGMHAFLPVKNCGFWPLFFVVCIPDFLKG